LQKALLDSSLHPPEHWETLEIQARTPAGRVRQLRLVSAQGGNRMSASTFRFAVDRVLGWNQIRSDLYEVRDTGTQIVFSGRGSGHGVGLCQTGAVQMGREGKNYREILAFYYPGTMLGLTAQGMAWQSHKNERVEVISTSDTVDARLLRMSTRLIGEVEQRSGLRFDYRPRLKVFPSVATYRDSTGEPGWIAASSRGQTIRLQPPELLRERRVLEQTLRHELLHQLIESHAHDGLPVWFREGLVLYLANDATGRLAQVANLEQVLTHARDRQEMEAGYSAAKAQVAALVNGNGRDTVMGWLVRGLPSDIAVKARTPQSTQN
jgi:stage II sporulation protein D